MQGAPTREMSALMAALARRIPQADADPSRTRISHGDYRMDNLVFDAVQQGGLPRLLWWLCAIEEGANHCYRNRMSACPLPACRVKHHDT
jgi:hypothetical protein